MAQEEALGVDFAQLYKNIQVAFLFNQITGSFLNFFFSLLFLCLRNATFWPALKWNQFRGSFYTFTLFNERIIRSVCLKLPNWNKAFIKDLSIPPRFKWPLLPNSVLATFFDTMHCFSVETALVCRHPLRKPASDPGSNGHLGYEEFLIFIAFLQFNKKVHQSGMWATKRHAKCFLAGRRNPSRKKACVSVTIRMRLAKVVPCSVALTKFELFFCLLVQER